MKKLSEKQIIWWKRQKSGGKLRFAAKQIFLMTAVLVSTIVATKFSFGEEIRLRSIVAALTIGAIFGLAKSLVEWDIFDTRYKAMFNRNKSF